MARERLGREDFHASLTLPRIPAVRLDCFLCRRTCALSAVVCCCNQTKASCVDHWRDLCDCEARFKCVVLFCEVSDVAACIRAVVARRDELVRPAHCRGFSPIMANCCCLQDVGVRVKAKETLLGAASEASDNGGCGICGCILVEGGVDSVVHLGISRRCSECARFARAALFPFD